MASVLEQMSIQREIASLTCRARAFIATEVSHVTSVTPAEGRIEPEDGTLMCSYHGWRFQGDGACTKVPQALDERANAAACSNSRSSAVSHPTQVHAGPTLGSKTSPCCPSKGLIDRSQLILACLIVEKHKCGSSGQPYQRREMPKLLWQLWGS